jgi:hypothetical protein
MTPVVDADLLNEAIQNIAIKRYMSEVREAIIYGDSVLGELMGEYMRLHDKRESEQIKVQE